MSNRNYFLFLFSGLLIIANSIKAQDPHQYMDSDRPQYTQSTTVIAPNQMQSEVGFMYTSYRSGNFRIRGYIFPDILVRFGIHEKIEFRIGINHVIISESGRIGDYDFLTDIYLGTKIKLNEQDGWNPNASVIIQGTVPIGSSPDDKIIIEPNFLLSWSLSHSFGFAMNIGENSMSELRDGFGLPISFAFQVKPSSGIGAYLELLSVVLRGSISGDSSPQYFINGGFSFLFSKNLQLDTFFGEELKAPYKFYFVGIGLSLRRNK